MGGDATRLAALLLTGLVCGATRAVERGLDLFWRDPDGAWRIMRFIAFTESGDE